MNPSDALTSYNSSDKKLLKSSNKRKVSKFQHGRKKRRIFFHGGAGPLNSNLAKSATAAAEGIRNSILFS